MNVRSARIGCDGWKEHNDVRYGFDIYRKTADPVQEPASPWGWTPRRGEVCTGEHVVQEHDNTLTYIGADEDLAAAFARGSRLSQVALLRPDLVFYPSGYDGCSPDATMFVPTQRRGLFGRTRGMVGSRPA